MYALFHGDQSRASLVRSSLDSIANLLLMGILIDSLCQWLILGVSHPGAALVVGPVLVSVLYAVARALANRVTRHGLDEGRR